jgi:hypothetical protein
MKMKKTKPVDLFINTSVYQNNNICILGKPDKSSKTHFTGNGYETYCYDAPDNKEIISQNTNDCQKSETDK